MSTVITLEGAKLPSYLVSEKFSIPFSGAVTTWIASQNPLVAALSAGVVMFGGGLAVAYGVSWGLHKSKGVHGHVFHRRRRPRRRH